jgi:hypothetical protein
MDRFGNGGETPNINLIRPTMTSFPLSVGGGSTGYKHPCVFRERSDQCQVLRRKWYVKEAVTYDRSGKPVMRSNGSPSPGSDSVSKVWPP